MGAPPLLPTLSEVERAEEDRLLRADLPPGSADVVAALVEHYAADPTPAARVMSAMLDAFQRDPDHVLGSSELRQLVRSLGSCDDAQWAAEYRPVCASFGADPQ